MRITLLIFLVALGLCPPAWAASPLLNRAAAKWLSEGDRWAFTAHVREYDRSDVLKEVRVERFDPSKPGTAAWELKSVNGVPPTDERRQAWDKHKAKRLRREPRAIADYFDFDNARVASANPQAITYRLPVRSAHSVLFPLEGIVLMVTVNRASLAITEIKASIESPFRTALGLARIVAVNFDVHIDPLTPGGPIPGPATAKPTGVAEVVIEKLAARSEYSWSEFERVTPAAESAAGGKPGEK
jgi:hypothetical protein